MKHAIKGIRTRALSDRKKKKKKKRGRPRNTKVAILLIQLFNMKLYISKIKKQQINQHVLVFKTQMRLKVKSV